MKYTTYVGSYTGAGHNEGIHILESDAETGDFRLMNVIDTVADPIYMALNRDCTRLYTVLARPASLSQSFPRFSRSRRTRRTSPT